MNKCLVVAYVLSMAILLVIIGSIAYGKMDQEPVQVEQEVIGQNSTEDCF